MPPIQLVQHWLSRIADNQIIMIAGILLLIYFEIRKGDRHE